MGVDIHAFVEYREPVRGYVSLSEGELWLPYRQGGLYGALGISPEDGHCLYPPRGLPSDCGRVVRHGPYVRPAPDGESPQLSTPDEFSPGWLYLHEVLAALDHYPFPLEECQPTFRAAVAAMAELAKVPGADPRLVFYFDR